VKRRHNKRDLVRLFKERGLRAKRLLGQNFLVDHNVLEFLCRAADLERTDVVLEIGAGTGLLTEHLARRSVRVIAVEIDENLCALAGEYVGDLPNVSLLGCDIHGRRKRLHPDVRAALADALGPERPFVVVSNLPYCISSDLLLSLLEAPRPPERMVLTVQVEFADRLVAQPGSREYGPLTVQLRAVAEVERLRTLPPDVFWPVPNVESAVVRIRHDAERRARIASPRVLKSVIRALFAHRRKTAASALRRVGRRSLSRAEAASVLAAAGVPDDARGDGLSVEQAVAVSDALTRS
jgi:16S rRNA (adenine1518-N6/adenine1519-N6)-dimethyltransferase